MAYQWYAGLDLGQSQDFTALTLLESVATDPTGYHCRQLGRFPIGTRYPAIVERVKELLSSKPLKGKTALVVDKTGVGAAVVDLLRDAGLSPVAITIHGGDMMSRDDTGGYRVPKRDLVSNLQVLLQANPRRLEFAANMPEVDTLIKEMLAFKVKISQNGHDSYGNDWRENPHDDYVLAVAIAAWYAEYSQGGKMIAMPNFIYDHPGYDLDDGGPDPYERLARQHADTPIHRKWAKRHFCGECNREWREQTGQTEPGVIYSRA